MSYVHDNRRGPTKVRRWAVALVGLSALVLTSCASGGIAAPAGTLGATSTRAIPASIADLPLTNQADQSVSLASWRGKLVMLVPFLTLCDDVCPLTTGNLFQIEQMLRNDGVAKRVQIVELSVDPGRDSPARLAAYAKLFGANWELVTETPATLRTIAKYFGFFYQRVPEGKPADIDWWTHKPLTYDINHSDGFVLINSHGTERFATDAAPKFHGTLNSTIHAFLSPGGLNDLRHAPHPNWTPDQALGAIAWVMQRALNT